MYNTREQFLKREARNQKILEVVGGTLTMIAFWGVIGLILYAIHPVVLIIAVVITLLPLLLWGILHITNRRLYEVLKFIIDPFGRLKG